jgi:hypothetical protein
MVTVTHCGHRRSIYAFPAKHAAPGATQSINIDAPCHLGSSGVMSSSQCTRRERSAGRPTSGSSWLSCRIFGKDALPRAPIYRSLPAAPTSVVGTPKHARRRQQVRPRTRWTIVIGEVTRVRNISRRVVPRTVSRGISRSTAGAVTGPPEIRDVAWPPHPGAHPHAREPSLRTHRATGPRRPREIGNAPHAARRSTVSCEYTGTSAMGAGPDGGARGGRPGTAPTARPVVPRGHPPAPPKPCFEIDRLIRSSESADLDRLPGAAEDALSAPPDRRAAGQRTSGETVDGACHTFICRPSVSRFRRGLNDGSARSHRRVRRAPTIRLSPCQAAVLRQVSGENAKRISGGQVSSASPDNRR